MCYSVKEREIKNKIPCIEMNVRKIEIENKGKTSWKRERKVVWEEKEVRGKILTLGKGEGGGETEKR